MEKISSSNFAFAFSRGNAKRGNANCGKNNNFALHKKHIIPLSFIERDSFSGEKLRMAKIQYFEQ